MTTFGRCLESTPLLLIVTACRGETAVGPTWHAASLSPNAYVWKLTSSAEPASDGMITLTHLGDYLAGEYCESCVPPLFRTRWCNRAGTGPGWQVRNVEPYDGVRSGWVYLAGGELTPDAYYADVCHDSTGADLTTAQQHTNDSAAGVIHIRTYSRVGRRYHTYTLTGRNRYGSSLGYVLASGCNADSTLLWSVADTNGVLYGPFTAPGSVPGPAGTIVADQGALRFVKDGFKPQCIPEERAVASLIPFPPPARTPRRVRVMKQRFPLTEGGGAP